MASYEIPPEEVCMYFRKKYVYLKTSSEMIKKYKKQFNLKNEYYVFISKEDEDKCKSAMVIYNNIQETKQFEARKKEVLERNKTRHGKGKCKITFSETANAEFAFLTQNVEFTESKLRAAAREMKMGLHEFMAYFNSHKNKLHVQTKAKEPQVVHSWHKHTAAKREIRENPEKRTKKIPQSMQERLHFHAHKSTHTRKNNNNNNSRPTSDASEEDITVLYPGLLSFDQKSGKISNSVDHSFKDKIKSIKITAASNENTENEFCKKKKEEEDLYIYPKIKRELRVCLTNIDVEVYRAVSHTATKRKIEEKTEKTRKVARSLFQESVSIHTHDTEKNTNDIEREKKSIHLSSSPDASEKKIAVLHPHSSKKIESTKFAAVCENTKIFCKNKEEIVLSPEEDVQVSHVEHAHSRIAAKRKFEGKTKQTRKIPRSLEKRVSVRMPPSDASEKNITLLHLDQCGKLSNSVENIYSFKDKIDRAHTEIATIPSENTKNEFCKRGVEEREITPPEREDPYVCAEQVAKKLASMYTSVESACVKAERKEITVLHPGGAVLSLDQTEKLEKSVEKNYSKAKIESSEIATDSSENTENEFCKKGGEEEREITPPEREIPYACAKQVAKELDSMYIYTAESACVKAEKKEITVLHPGGGVLSLDQTGKLAYSVEEIHSFQAKIESSEITIPSENTENVCIKGEENEEIIPEGRNVLNIYPEELSVCVCAEPLSEESADTVLNISADSVSVTNTDVQVSPHFAHHTCSRTATKGKIGEEKKSEGAKEKYISQSDTVDRLSFHMYSFTEKHNKNVNTHTHPTSDSSDEEIKDIQQVFKRAEITDASSEITENEFCKMREKGGEDTIPEDTLEHYFSGKCVGIQEDLHTYIGESSVARIPENPAEESDVYVVSEDGAVECENLSDDDLGFLLTKDYVHDTLSRERDQISAEGYFSSHPKQYEDISIAESLFSAPFLKKQTLSDFTVHPPVNKNKVDKVFVNLNKVTVSLPSVYDSDEVVVFFKESEWEEENMYKIPEYPSNSMHKIHEYLPPSKKLNSSKQICHPPSTSVPKYNAASFYDMVSSEILEDKILE